MAFWRSGSGRASGLGTIAEDDDRLAPIVAFDGQVGDGYGVFAELRPGEADVGPGARTGRAMPTRAYAFMNSAGQPIPLPRRASTSASEMHLPLHRNGGNSGRHRQNVDRERGAERQRQFLSHMIPPTGSMVGEEVYPISPRVAQFRSEVNTWRRCSRSSCRKNLRWSWERAGGACGSERGTISPCMPRSSNPQVKMWILIVALGPVPMMVKGLGEIRSMAWLSLVLRFFCLSG